MGWGGQRPTRKNKKINDLRSILRNFIQFCVGYRYRLIEVLASAVAHPKNLNNLIVGLFCETLNNFSIVLVFGGFKSDIRDFCDVYTRHVSKYF